MKQIAVLFCLFSTLTFAQVTPVDFGGGEYIFHSTEDKCLSDADRAAIQERLKVNSLRLQMAGKLVLSGDREDVKFIWPLRKADGFEWNSYYGISNYVDQNTTIDALGDYHCDERTYDGHFGTDIFTWPFPWYQYENDYCEIIAGEPGVIIEKDDGFDDDHCECFGSWNAVYVQHEDGSVAWYGHMKKGSLTSKEVGDAVEEGEFLGVVASSGCSTGPHLHLEVYDGEGNLIDPYGGDCNELNDVSWWEDQPENREPTINTILTHDDVPDHGCPQINEDPHIQNEFFPGDVIYTAFYFHDALSGTEGFYRLRMPDGTIWNDWSNVHGTTYNASWWYWSWELPEDGPFGIWTLEADYNGTTVSHEFTYGVYANIDEEDESNFTLSPNPAQNEVLINGVDNIAQIPISIFDASGRLILSTQSQNGKIDVSELSNGAYTLVLNDQKGMTKRLVIAK